MRTFLKIAGLAVLASGSAAVLAGSSGTAASLDGRWDAQLVRGDTVIPFRLDISGAGTSLKGTLYDGFRPYENTTSASFKDGKLVLNLEHYLTTITATLDDGQLNGDVVAQNREARADYGFVATKHVESPGRRGERAVDRRQLGNSARCAFAEGREGVPLHRRAEGRGSRRVDPAHRWRHRCLQRHVQGRQVAAEPLRRLAPGRDRRHAESGRHARSPAAVAAARGRATAQRTSSSYGASAPDGRYSPTLVAYRSEVARAKGFPEPANFLTHTTARDPNEKFAFNFPNVDGKLVSSEDPNFQGKVIIAVVTGTWCPNCHDEAQYLVRARQAVSRQGSAHRRAELRRAGAAGSADPRARLREAVRRRPIPTCSPARRPRCGRRCRSS